MVSMRSLLLFPIGLAACGALAQDDGFRCLANNPAELERHLLEHPGAQQAAMEAKATLDARTASFNRGGQGPFIISVVFHVIHNNGPENISDEQLEDAIRVLNQDYNKLNPDTGLVRPEFQGIIADVGIEFRLARRDPEGNCTNGITRTVSTRTYDGDFEMTQLIQWPRDRYMNVWVAASANGAAGYTYYPMWLDGWPEADGIVILHDYTGSIGTSSAYRSRVLSHEVGHWLNLKHCWGDSNEPGVEQNCSVDDEVADTPLTIGWTSCVLSGASCGSTLDNVQNYMEYSYCCRMFTQGQGDRMIAALTSPIAERESLWQPSTLALTGVMEPEQLCMARFEADRRELCAGSSVQFTDMSYFGVSARSWSFEGGSPGGSFDAQPLVTYDAPGTYAVTLVVSDGSASESSAVPGYITVLPNPGLPAPWSEGFESGPDVPNDRWRVVNPDDDVTFAITTAAAYTGTRCVRLTNSSAQDGRRDELISTAIDLTGIADPVLSFRYAYARRNPINDDVLYVYASGDCGETWVLRKVIRAITTLVTAPQTNGSFVPAGADQWGYAALTNIGPALQTTSFRMRFLFESDGGNNLYLDDINLNGIPVGIEETVSPAQSARMVPNPIDGSGVVLSDLPDGPVEWRLMNALGQVTGTGASLIQHGRFPFPAATVPAGSYSLLLRAGDQARSARFIVP